MKVDKERLTNFIEINHYFMTVTEMAEETGANFPLVKRICDSNGWKPITIAERMATFIESNKNLSLEDQADKLEISVTGLKHHYEKLGIPLPERKRKNARIDDSPVIQQEEVKQKSDKKPKEKTVIDRRSFTYYTQSGTDMLDRINGIQTTIRNDRLLI